MRFQALLATFIVSFAVELSAQCVSTMYPPNSAASIGVRVGSGWSEAPPIASAIGLWSNNCAGMEGSDFPDLVSESDGAITIYVSRMQGQIPQGDAGCARFNHELDSENRVTGGTIEVYEQDSAGNDCTWVLPHVTLDNLIAHELGHVLGLANTLCSSYIMGPNWATTNPSSEECGWIDYAWPLPNEVDNTGNPNDGGGDGDEESEPPQPCDDGNGTCSPILIDLNDDGYQLTTAANGVWFDIDGDGRLDAISWTAPGADEAFLWLDGNGNGFVDDGNELFGDAEYPNGFERLITFDSPNAGGNADGVITPADAIWSSLLLWTDANHNGLSEPHEIGRLAQTQFDAIELKYRVIGKRDKAGNRFRYMSRISRSGRAAHAHLFDVVFVRR